MNRKLGSSEYVAWLSDQVGSLNFVTVAHVSGGLDEQTLRTALDLLSHRHPLLKTRIDIQEDRPVFVADNVPAIPLEVEARLSDDHWHAEVEKEMNRHFSWSEGPLVRVTLLKGAPVSDLLVTFHHTIGEAASGMYFMLHLLTLVKQISEGNEPDVQPFPERPPVEELLPKSARDIQGLVKTGALISKQVASIIIQHPQKLPKDGDAYAENRQARVIHCTLSEEETESLVNKCREESTTVHGAVCAAVLHAAASQMHTYHDGKSVTIGCMSAVNLRQFLTPPLGEEIGFFVSMVITSHRIHTDTHFWDVARDVKEAVHHAIGSGDAFVFISLLDKLIRNTSPDDFMKRAVKLYPAALLVTNVGRLDIPQQYGSLVLEGLHFTLANKAASEHFNTAVATYNNRLIINFSYTEPTMSPERAHTLVEDAMKVLTSAHSG